jgi:hypothetical protein
MVNDVLIREHDYDLERLINSFQTTTLSFGSEFRPVNRLTKVLGGHPKFGALLSFVEQGMSYKFKRQISEDERIKKLEGMIARGNHKLAEAGADKARELLAKDVLHGFLIPISPETVTLIKGAMVQPLGLASQFTLAEDGSRKEKFRLTQDLSFSLTDELNSINERIGMSEYRDMIYGWRASPIIHFIVSLRLEYPEARIFIAKYDYSDTALSIPSVMRSSMSFNSAS